MQRLVLVHGKAIPLGGFEGSIADSVGKICIFGRLLGAAGQNFLRGQGDDENPGMRGLRGMVD